MTPVLTAPEGYDATVKPAQASKVLRYLLTGNPNTIVTCADVIDVLGYEVTRTTIHAAADVMRRGPFGLTIVAKRTGGYMLLVPVPATGPDCCDTCGACSVIGACRTLKGRPVERRPWCGGWCS